MTRSQNPSKGGATTMRSRASLARLVAVATVAAVAEPGRSRAERLEIARVKRRTVLAIVGFAVLLTAIALWLVGLSGARPAV
jgi:hypothetical protein